MVPTETDPAELPVPLPGQSPEAYRELAKAIAGLGLRNARLCLRRGNAAGAIDALGEAVRLLQSIVVFSEESPAGDGVDLAGAASVASFSGIGGASAEYSPEATTTSRPSLDGAGKFAEARRIQLQQTIEGVRALTPAIEARGDTLA